MELGVGHAALAHASSALCLCAFATLCLCAIKTEELLYRRKFKDILAEYLYNYKTVSYVFVSALASGPGRGMFLSYKGNL
jgi:hypothetical protein